jgi:tetratricopeptide (TPR) repeat protein
MSWHETLLSAREAFEKSLKLARDYDAKTELPGILHQSSNVYWLLGENAEARKRNDEAYELSKEIPDYRYAVDSLVGKAEFDYDEGKFERISEYAQELRDEYESEGYNYPLFFGRMRRIQADVAFSEGDKETAREKYTKGLGQIIQHGGYGMYFIDRELERLERTLSTIPREAASDWLVYFKENWSKLSVEGHEYLLDWCDRQMVRVKLGIFA